MGQLFGKTTPFSSNTRGRRSTGHLPAVLTSRFLYGLMNYLDPQDVPRGAAVDPTINFITRGSKIETRNGYAAIAGEGGGSGSVSNTFTAHRWDGSEVLFQASGNSLFYLNDATDLFVEVGGAGANILAGNNGERIWISEYQSDAGAQLWVSSTHSDLIKIMVANPGDWASQYLAAKNFKGSISIKKSAMFLWNYLSGTGVSATKNTLQRSYIDAQKYTTAASEAIGTGGGVQVNFTGTLAFKAITPRATCFGVTMTDGNETFVDDYLGNLNGNKGGTGTINYMTGAYSINFGTAPAVSAPVTATYQSEDSTNNGIADFTQSATRNAGEGNAFLQNTGGAILNTFTLQGTEYVLHEHSSWYLTISADDSTATQDIFRERMTMASDFGGVATADGIYYIDTTELSNPFVSLIRYSPISQLAYPDDLSSGILDLSAYSFDKCVAFEWDQFILFACRTNDSIVNNRILLYNTSISSTKIRVFDLVDFFANCFAIKSGALIAGDSATQNVFNLFANFDDDGAIPNMKWTGGIDDLGIASLKKVKRFWIEGEIDVGQSVNVNVQNDRGGFSTVGTISGDGAYVDQGTPVSVGSVIVGYQPVGGAPSNEKTSQHYLCEIRLARDSFRDRQIQFVPQGIGYFSVTSATDQDINYHQDKLPRKYRQAV